MKFFVIVLMLFVLTACGASASSYSLQQPVQKPEHLLNMDSGDKVAWRCDHGNMIYTSSGGGIAVVPQDVSCQ